LYSNVQHAGLYSILPHSLLSVLDTRTSISATPLLPELTREIGLITRNSPSMPPLAAAMWSAAERLDLQQSFDALLQKTDIAALQ
jgi:hypothetical protein